MTEHIDERDGYDELADYVQAIKKRVAAKKKASAKKLPVTMTKAKHESQESPVSNVHDRLTVASLEDMASGLERNRRGKYGDGKPSGEPERGGMGLYETSMRLTEADAFEVVYSTGGHGGPYPSEAAAKAHAVRYMNGFKRERWIAIIAAKDNTDLVKAKALWVLKRKSAFPRSAGGSDDPPEWVKGPQPLPNVNPAKHVSAQTEASAKGKIPGLPAGWHGKNREASWTSKNGHEYRVGYNDGPTSANGWTVVHFKPGARLGDTLQVSDFDPKWKPKMFPLSAKDTAVFPHAFSAADAAMDFDKKHGDGKDEAVANRLGKALSEAVSRHQQE